VVFDREEANDDYQQTREYVNDVLIPPGVQQQKKNSTPCNGSGGVDFPLENNRNFIGKYIPQYPSEARRHGSEKDANNGVKAGLQAQLYSGDGEKSQAQGVKQEKGFSKSQQTASEYKGRQGGGQNDVEIGHVHHPANRQSSDENVPEGSATNGRYQSEYHHTERVKSLLHSGQGTGHGKNGCSREIEYGEYGHELLVLAAKKCFFAQTTSRND
jgi:hypothetical protein